MVFSLPKTKTLVVYTRVTVAWPALPHLFCIMNIEPICGNNK